jgi:hypothetical protein
MVTINTVAKCLDLWIGAKGPKIQSDIVSYNSVWSDWVSYPSAGAIQLITVPDYSPEYACGLRMGDLLQAVTCDKKIYPIDTNGLCLSGMVPFEAILAMLPIESSFTYHIKRMDRTGAFREIDISSKIEKGPEGYDEVVLFPEYRIVSGVVFTYMGYDMQKRSVIYYNNRCLSTMPIAAVSTLPDSRVEIICPSRVTEVVKKNGKIITPRQLEDLDNCRLIRTDFGVVPV